jgi:GNAT superfamily N-acetyltransferase
MPHPTRQTEQAETKTRAIPTDVRHHSPLARPFTLWHYRAMSAMNEAIIEQATMEDLPQMVDLLYELFGQEGDFVPDRAKQERGLRLILEQPNRGRIFVYRWNDAIVGMVNLLFTISTAEGGFVVLLEDVIVRVDYRGRGVGRQLLTHAIEYAKKKEFLRITLLTDRLNEQGQVFFQKMGFFKSQMIPLRLPLTQDSATLPKS